MLGERPLVRGMDCFDKDGQRQAALRAAPGPECHDPCVTINPGTDVLLVGRRGFADLAPFGAGREPTLLDSAATACGRSTPAGYGPGSFVCRCKGDDLASVCWFDVILLILSKQIAAWMLTTLHSLRIQITTDGLSHLLMYLVADGDRASCLWPNHNGHRPFGSLRLHAVFHVQSVNAPSLIHPAKSQGAVTRPWRKALEHALRQP